MSGGGQILSIIYMVCVKNRAVFAIVNLALVICFNIVLTSMQYVNSFLFFRQLQTTENPSSETAKLH